MHRSLPGCGSGPCHRLEEDRCGLCVDSRMDAQVNGCILTRNFRRLITWQHGHWRMNWVIMRSVIVGSLRNSLHFWRPRWPTMELCTAAMCLSSHRSNVHRMRCFSSHWEIDYRKIIGIHRDFDCKLLHRYFLTVSEVTPNLMVLLLFRSNLK